MKKLLKGVICISTFASLSFLISGAILLPYKQNLSQLLGYTSFLFILLGAIGGLAYVRIIKNYGPDHINDTVESEKSPRSSTFVLLNLIAATFIVVVMLQKILFSSAGIINENPNTSLSALWPFPFSLYSGYTGNNQGFIVQSLFVNLESLVPMPLYIYEKVTLITELYFYYFLAAAVSTVVYRAFGFRKINETVFSIFFASLFLFNFIFRSEGFSSFIIGPIMLTYAIAKIYESIKFRRYQTSDALKIGLAEAFGIFGDPRLIVYFSLLSLGIILTAFLIKRVKEITKFIVKSYAIIISLFCVMYFMTSFVPAFQANAGRSGDYSTIAFFSSSTQPMYVFDFIANWWSNFVVASPQIISSGLGDVNYLKTLYAGNAIAVVPSGIATVIWSISLSTVSVFSILSLYLISRDRNNKYMSLLFVPFLFLFMLTLGTNIRFPLFVHFIAALSNIPLLGPLWAVTVSTPQFVDTYLSSYLIFFASYSVLSISEIEMKPEGRFKHGHIILGIQKKYGKQFRYTILLFVLIMFLFANWQMIDQSYALGQELPGELPGNQVGLDTFLSSVNPPPGWITAYDSLYSPTNLSYTVYTNDAYNKLLKWDSAFNIGSSPGIAPNPEFSSLLSDVVSQNLSNLIPTLMVEYGVKYIFFDKSQVEPNWKFLDELNGSGLKITTNTENYTIFSLPGASALSLFNTTFSLPGGSPESVLNLTYLLSSVGYHMALSPGNNSTYILTNNLAETRNGVYIPLNNLTGIFPSGKIPKPLVNLKGSVSSVGSHWLGNDWGDIGYNGGYYINYTFSDGTFSVKKYTPAGTSSPNSSYYIFYTNNSSNPIAGGIIPVPMGDEAIVNYSFTYKTDAMGNVTFSAGSNTVNLPYNPSGKYVSGSVIIPPGTGSFGISFGLSKYNGTLNLSKMNISYTIMNHSLVKTTSFKQVSSLVSTYSIPKPLVNLKGSVSSVGSHWLGNDWGDIGYNGGYYINYTFSDGTFSVKKYTPAGTSSPNSSYYIFYTNNSSNPIAGGIIPVPMGDEAIVNYSFTYKTDAMGNVTFSAGSNTVNLPYNPSGKYVSGSVIIPPGTGSFGISFGLSKYNGTLNLSKMNISYTIMHNSIETVKGHTFSFNAIPNEKYDVIFTASNNSYSSQNMNKVVEASSTGKLYFNTSIFNYIGQFAIIPLNNVTQNTFSVPQTEFQNGGASIHLKDFGQSYLVISYSNDYGWVSPSLVYLGVNSLGQQIYKVIKPGSVNIEISGYEVHMYTDWIAAVMVNLILPVLLFYPEALKKISLMVKSKLFH